MWRAVTCVADLHVGGEGGVSVWDVRSVCCLEARRLMVGLQVERVLLLLKLPLLTQVFAVQRRGFDDTVSVLMVVVVLRRHHPVTVRNPR